MSILTDSMTDN